MPFYAVAVGRNPGIYTSWTETQKQVRGYQNARHKKFSSEEQAKEFINQYATSAIPSTQPPTFPHHQAASLPTTSSLTTTTTKSKRLSISDSTAFTSASPLAPTPFLPPAIVAFCDGSALNNGRRNAKSGYACIFPNHPPLSEFGTTPGFQTNNRGEFYAALQALRKANQVDASGKEMLTVFTDSKLLIKSMTEWIKGWMKRDWKKSDGEPVKNKDLLVELVRERGDRLVVWKHVPAHTGRRDWQSFWNDKADRMAKEGARK